MARVEHLLSAEETFNPNSALDNSAVLQSLGTPVDSYVGKVDIVLPYATHNEVSMHQAKFLISSGCKLIAEECNTRYSAEAIGLFMKHRKGKKKGSVWFAPGMLITYHRSIDRV